MLADAIEKGDPRTKNLWFDVTTVSDPNTSPEQAALVARRIRQIGVKRSSRRSQGTARIDQRARKVRRVPPEETTSSGASTAAKRLFPLTSRFGF